MSKKFQEVYKITEVEKIIDKIGQELNTLKSDYEYQQLINEAKRKLKTCVALKAYTLFKNKETEKLIKLSKTHAIKTDKGKRFEIIFYDDGSCLFRHDHGSPPHSITPMYDKAPEISFSSREFPAQEEE